MNLRDRNLRFALLKAMADAINSEIAAERTAHKGDLVERYEDEGTKSFDVRMPNGVKVATISLSVPTQSTEVTDDAALLEWALVNNPHLVTTHDHPAVPRQIIPAQKAWSEDVLNRKAVTTFLTNVKPADPTGGAVVDVDTGEVIPGITYTPTGTPSSFSVRFVDDGRDTLARAWRAGELEHVTAGSILPALGD